jgi:hypothetical protein
MSEFNYDYDSNVDGSHRWLIKLKIFLFLGATVCVLGFIGLSYLFMHLRLNTAAILSKSKRGLDVHFNKTLWTRGGIRRRLQAMASRSKKR